MRLMGAILAGGASSRMGTPKEGVVLSDGRAMIEHVASALRPVVDGLVVAGSCDGFNTARIGATRIGDLRPGLGPLAGIEAILRSGMADGYLIATCDQPMLTCDLLDRLVAHARDEPAVLRTVDGTSLAPFPCFLPASLASAVGAALDVGERSPRRLLDALRVRFVDAPASAGLLVVSLNSPADIERHALRGATPPGHGSG